MSNLPIIDLVPESLRQRAIDSTIDFVANQAEKLLGRKAGETIRHLHSEASFRESFNAGLERALNRFFEEYRLQDEDLAAALEKETDLFQNQDVQKALLHILQQPDIYLESDQAVVLNSFNNVLPSRLNRERVDRAVSRFVICLAREVWNLPELREVYMALYAKGTYEASQEQVVLQRSQIGLQQEQIGLQRGQLFLQQESLRALAGLEVGIRDTVLQLTAAIQQQKLLTARAEKALPSPKKVYHNLPRPDYARFVGRQKELEKVHSLLLPETRHFSICVDGIGGVGKSALALEVAYHYYSQYDLLPSEQRFEAIIWASAKEKVLTPGGITTRARVLHTVEDIYTAIAITLDREDIRRAKPEEQDELIRQALSQLRTLLILDNMDTVDDTRMLNFVYELPEPTKVILTTRHWRDISYPIRLAELEETDSLTLIADETKKKGVDLTDDAARHLYKATGGLPLAIVWSIGLMGFSRDIDLVLSYLVRAESPLAYFCFEGSVEQIRGTPAHQLLMAFSLFAADASQEALSYVTDLSESDLREGLAELETLSLINPDGSRFRALALTLRYAKAELDKEPDRKANYRDRWLTFWVNLLGAPRQNHYERLEQVRLEFRNLLAAMDFCWLAGKVETLIVLAWRMEFYFRMTGNWMAWNSYTEIALEVAPSLGGERGELALANLSFSLAMLRTSQGDISMSQNLLSKAIKIYQLYNDQEGMAFALWWLGSTQDDTELARKTQNRALQIARSLKHRVLIARIERQLGLLDRNDGNYELAEKRLKRSVEWQGQEAQPSLGLILSYIALGQISIEKPSHDYDSATRYFEEALDKAKQLNIPHGVAIATLYLAEMKWRLGLTDQAKTLAKEAMERFTILGMKQDLLQTQTLLNQMS